MSSAGSPERLAALAAAFRERLAQDASRLRALDDALGIATADERTSALAEVRSIGHKLYGTAPAFDAADIGAAAGELEQAATAASHRFEENAPILRTRVRALLEILDSACGAHGGGRTFTPRL